MFTDPLVSLMVMLMLCFVGTLVMFLFVIRALASHTAAMREQVARQMSVLGDLEHQLMDMSFVLRKMKSSDADEAKEPAVRGNDVAVLLGAISAAAARSEQNAEEASAGLELDTLIRPSQSARLTPTNSLPDLDFSGTLEGAKSGGARAGSGLDIRIGS